MENEKVIKFPSTDLNFCDELEGNGFLELTAINALNALGYSLSEEGVKEYQRAINVEETGIIDLETFTTIIYSLEKDDTQKVLNELNDHMKTVNKRAKRKNTIEGIMIFIGFALFIIILWLGSVELIHHVTGFIKKLF